MTKVLTASLWRWRAGIIQQQPDKVNLETAGSACKGKTGNPLLTGEEGCCHVAMTHAATSLNESCSLPALSSVGLYTPAPISAHARHNSLQVWQEELRSCRAVCGHTVLYFVHETSRWMASSATAAIAQQVLR